MSGVVSVVQELPAFGAVTCAVTGKIAASKPESYCMARHLIASDKTIQKAANEGARRLSDGEGLYLLFSVKGASHGWRFDYTFERERKTLSLGTYPDTGLSLARKKADECRKMLAAGLNPSDARKDKRAATLKAAEAARRIEAEEAPGSFEAVAREWHKTVHTAKTSESHAARTLTRLEQDAFPWFGSTPIGDVTAPMLLAALRKVEDRGAIETAHRVKQACGQVFRFGIATGGCERDPSADLNDALKPVIVKHRAAIVDPASIGSLLRAIHDYEGHPVTRAALKLAPLIFLRPGELRQAERAEIDLDAGMWTIPAARMKRTKQQKLSGAPHLVPLSTQAIAVLKELHPLTGRSRYVLQRALRHRQDCGHQTLRKLQPPVWSQPRRRLPQRHAHQPMDHIYQDRHIDNAHFHLHYGDLTDSTNLIRIVQETQPDEIYNLGAQNHVAVSFESPEYTADVDARPCES